MTTINLEREETLYLLELLNADIARMRQLTEHARSHGLRDYLIPEHTTALVLVEMLTPATATPEAPPEPAVICLACGEPVPESEHATHACLDRPTPGVVTQVKCDGEHATAACADPQCWRRVPKPIISPMDTVEELKRIRDHAFGIGYYIGTEDGNDSTIDVEKAREKYKQDYKCDGNHGGPPCLDPECWARA